MTFDWDEAAIYFGLNCWRHPNHPWRILFSCPLSSSDLIEIVNWWGDYVSENITPHCKRNIIIGYFVVYFEDDEDAVTIKIICDEVVNRSEHITKY